MSAVLTAPSSTLAAQSPIRVMVVDDSVVVRGLVTRWLEEESDLKVVGSMRTGRQAVDQLDKVDPDVVILDIEMPELDGLSALPLLLAKKRDLTVIMASTLTRRHAEVSLKALSLGATDYIPKPESNHGVTTSLEFRRELIEKVRSLGRRRTRRQTSTVAPPLVPAAPQAVSTALPQTTHAPAAPLTLRHAFAKPPRALLIGSSTGGPQALMKVIASLPGVIDRVPVLIVQHMPATFTTILAEHLTRIVNRPVREPREGDPVLPGTVFLAPGGRHMLVARRDNQPIIHLDDGPAVNFCKPAVDPMFETASAFWNGAAQAVILTGMGHDGTEGARVLVGAGGSVIAQDEATSVVWGMPGAAAHAGICSAVLPLDQIGPKIVRVFSGEQP